MKQIFGTDWINDLYESHPDVYIDVIDEFQKAKEQFYEKTGLKNHNVHLPMDFIGFIQEKLDDGNMEIDEVEALVASKMIDGKPNLIKLDEERMSIDISLWQKMFDHVIDPTINHIKKLLDEANTMKNCKYLCLLKINLFQYNHIPLSGFGLRFE